MVCRRKRCSTQFWGNCITNARYPSTGAASSPPASGASVDPAGRAQIRIAKVPTPAPGAEGSGTAKGCGV